VPGKPVTEVIVSHAHFDHVRGIRDAIAEGLTIIARRGNEGILQEMAMHDAPDFPDALELNPRPLDFLPVDEHLRLEDDQLTVDVYWGRANIHMADMVFAYVPGQNIFVEGDMATAAREWQFWGDNYLDNIEHYGLDVDMIAPVHMPIMTQDEVVEMVRGGVERARAHCASELGRGDYFPGCPVQSRHF
jgi:glyoxylase-like metal-dependent hydrolase (beta-lactamase superfamily II)